MYFLFQTLEWQYIANQNTVSVKQDTQRAFLTFKLIYVPPAHQMTKSKHNCTKSYVHTATTRLHNRTVTIYIVRYPSWLHISASRMLIAAVNTKQIQPLLIRILRGNNGERLVNNSVTEESWDLWCHKRVSLVLTFSSWAVPVSRSALTTWRRKDRFQWLCCLAWCG